MQNINTCLWFDNQAAEAADFYVGIFPNSKIIATTYNPDGAPGPAGSVLTVKFMLDGIEFVALNGGPVFQFTPAISLVAHTDSQEETDRIWAALAKDGKESRCAWLTDKFGVSWQVVPRRLIELLSSKDKAASQRAMAAMLTMSRIDIHAIERAYNAQ